PGLGMPVLGVLGLENEAMGWGTQGDDVEPFLPPGAQFVPLEDAGHFVHVEQPDKVASLVLDFLGAAPADGAAWGPIGTGTPQPGLALPDADQTAERSRVRELTRGRAQ